MKKRNHTMTQTHISDNARETLQAGADSHALGVLEFDRILEIGASLAESREGRDTLIGSRPRTDAEEVRGMLAETGELMDAVRFDDPLPGTGVLDIREIFSSLRVEGFILEAEHIAAVAGNLETARNVREYFEDRSGKYPLVWEHAGRIAVHADLERMIRRVVTPDFSIADDASRELQSIRRRLAGARNSLRDLVEIKAERAVLQEQYRRISRELRVTTQRVNLFEKVKIPECKENIRVIQIYLSDQQTAAVGRSKIAKRKMEKVA